MEVMRYVLCLVALVGCDRLFNVGAVQVVDGGHDVDAKSVDTPPDNLPVQCLGSTGFTVCLESTPPQPLTLVGAIDTDTSTMCAANGGFGTNQPDSCIVVASTIAIVPGATVTVGGSRPLVPVAV